MAIKPSKISDRFIGLFCFCVSGLLSRNRTLRSKPADLVRRLPVEIPRFAADKAAVSFGDQKMSGFYASFGPAGFCGENGTLELTRAAPSAQNV